MRVRTFFGIYVGLQHIDLVRRAVAEKQVGVGDWAIYSHDYTGCDAGEGLEFDNGPGIVIDGRVHSNARYHVNSGHPPDDDFWAKRARSTRTRASRASTRSRTVRPTGMGQSRVTSCPRTGSSSRGPRGTRRSSSTGRTAAGRTSARRRSTSRPARSSSRARPSAAATVTSTTRATSPRAPTAPRKRSRRATRASRARSRSCPRRSRSAGTNLDFMPHSANVLFFQVPELERGVGA